MINWELQGIVNILQAGKWEKCHMMEPLLHYDSRALLKSLMIFIQSLLQKQTVPFGKDW